MMRRCVLALVAVSLVACAIRVERAGHERLLDSGFDWDTGRTTAEEVARDLGPPDEVRLGGSALEFVYRFERRRHSRFVLSYMLRLLTRDSDGVEARELIVSFDEESRLLGYRLLAPTSASLLDPQARSPR